jgi:hypothetical protein
MYLRDARLELLNNVAELVRKNSRTENVNDTVSHMAAIPEE